MFLVCCYAIARVFYVVARRLLSCFSVFLPIAMQFLGHFGWLLGGC